jgi:trk system potassium uptake protein TrkH
MPVIKAKSKGLDPTKTIVLSFLLVILAGTFLLTMPFSSKAGQFTNPVTALFTATSATCVTGLVIEDTGTYWNVFGQLVILIMIQIGGLGLVTLTSFFNFAIGRKLELRSIQMASESINLSGFSDVKNIIKSIIKICAIFEISGAVLLMCAFVPKYGLKGIYISIFISISAFCNGGFDVIGSVEQPFVSLMPFYNNPIIMTVVPLLIICGGLGFVVWHDVWNYRKTKKLVLQSQLVLTTTAVLIVLGTLMFLFSEWDNPATLRI